MAIELSHISDSEADTRRAVNTVVDEIEDALNNSLSMFATSTTTRTIGTGSHTFTVEAGRTFLYALPYVQAADRDDASKWMTGKVTSYIGTTLIVSMDDVGGTGSRSNWIIGVAGRRGL
ncbi:hypothetical protein EON83_20280 [bacterium]|nr:MAG: hypothetical protein EON83_20280 [bacterium]